MYCCLEFGNNIHTELPDYKAVYLDMKESYNTSKMEDNGEPHNDPLTGKNYFGFGLQGLTVIFPSQQPP